MIFFIKLYLRFINFFLIINKLKLFFDYNNLYKKKIKIDYLDVVEKLARKYGEDHLSLKCYGFKPDFWVTLADLLTVEGVMLDLATHTVFCFNINLIFKQKCNIKLKFINRRLNNKSKLFRKNNITNNKKNYKYNFMRIN